MAATAYSYIRFSTLEQQKGDSLRRQLEKSQAYAAEHGLTLDETLNMRDLGVSAFRKANIEGGRLGAFIEAIDKGVVKPGSYLIVESLDRLSRAEVIDALEIFLSILRREIIIVTLTDNRVYSRESVKANYSELIVSIAVMARSHDESLTKSVRRKASWDQAKKLAAECGKKITRKIPFWLSLQDITGEFVIKEEEAAAVRRIFSLAKVGLGYWKICQTLNQEGVKPPAKSNGSKKKIPENGWGTSSVAHVLTSEAVIGNLVVAQKSDSPQVIRGYYPKIVDEALFYEVQPRGKVKGGRASPLKTNLFTHLLFCGYCGGPMQVDTNVKAGVRRSKILCQKGRRGFGCTAKSWRYEEFEQSFFSFVSEVDVSVLIGNPVIDTALQDEVTVLRGRLEKNEERISRLIAAIEEGERPAMLLDRLRERESEQIVLERELKQKLLVVDNQLHSEQRLRQGFDSVKNLYAKMNELEGQERVMLRYSMAEHISSIIESISIYPNGLGVSLYSPLLDKPSVPDTTKSFHVNFKNGEVRIVKPEKGATIKIDLTRKSGM